VFDFNYGYKRPKTILCIKALKRKYLIKVVVKHAHRPETMKEMEVK
jgi:hypothetical protein